MIESNAAEYQDSLERLQAWLEIFSKVSQNQKRADAAGFDDTTRRDDTPQRGRDARSCMQGLTGECRVGGYSHRTMYSERDVSRRSLACLRDRAL